MDGHREVALDRQMRHGEAGGDEAFHIGAAATIEPAVSGSELEGIARPVLPLYGHDVGVAREDDPWLIFRADGRKKVGFAAVLARHHRRINIESIELMADIFDERQIAVAADGREGYERIEILKRPVGGHGESYPVSLLLSSLAKLAAAADPLHNMINHTEQANGTADYSCPGYGVG